MGLIKIFCLYVIPGSFLTVYSVFRLGNQLPFACRKMGRRIGLGYHLFKAVLKVNLPKDIGKSNEMIKLMRQAEQQANALNREMRATLQKMKQEVKGQLPKEIKTNPFKMLAMKSQYSDEPEKIDLNKGGSQIVHSYLQERERLILQQKEKKQRKEFQEKL